MAPLSPEHLAALIDVRIAELRPSRCPASGGRGNADHEQSAILIVLLDVLGDSLGQALEAERRAAKRKLSDEVRKLRVELTEAQTVVAELRQILAADRRTPLDLAALPRRELN